MSHTQVEMFARRGGQRANAGRKAGESTTVLRIPTACLNAVTEIISAHRTGTSLNAVTEIKDDATAHQAIRALREYYRHEYMAGGSDGAFVGWIDAILEADAESVEVNHG